MEEAPHPRLRAVRFAPASANLAAASLAILCGVLYPDCARAYPAAVMHRAAPCDPGAEAHLQRIDAAEVHATGTRLVIAFGTGSGSGGPRRNNPGIGGVIDRSIPRSSGVAGSAPDAALPQFNRIPDASSFASTVGTTGQASLPDPDGGPVLYTIIERPAQQQVRPVLYTPAAPARPNAASAAKRYCTVNEVRATAAACQ